MSSNSRQRHVCDECFKSFSSSHQLAQHTRIHTGEKPYKCSYCDKSFKQLSHVQQHTRLHTGERPYKCPKLDCGKAFIQLSNLNQHLKVHSNSRDDFTTNLVCNSCSKIFKSESSLLTHKCKGQNGAGQNGGHGGGGGGGEQYAGSSRGRPRSQPKHNSTMATSSVTSHSTSQNGTSSGSLSNITSVNESHSHHLNTFSRTLATHSAFLPDARDLLFHSPNLESSLFSPVLQANASNFIKGRARH